MATKRRSNEAGSSRSRANAEPKAEANAKSPPKSGSKTAPGSKPGAKKAKSGKVRNGKTPTTAKSGARARVSPSRTSSAFRDRHRKYRRKSWQRYGLAAMMLVTLAAGWYSYEQRLDAQAGRWMHQEWLEASAAAGFTFKELIVEGRSLTDKQDLVEAVGLHVGQSLFAVSLETIQRRVKALDMVKEAEVSRDLSGRIAIRLTERQPYARWRHEGTLRVVDRAGNVLHSEAPEDYRYLITILGEPAPRHLQELSALLQAEPDLAEEVVAAAYISNRRWNFHFHDGVTIMLPEQDPLAAWQRLAELNAEHALLSQQIEAIDLRIDDRIFLTLPEPLKQVDREPSDV